MVNSMVAQLDKIKDAETLLKIAAVILAGISAYTTEEGFRLIWNQDGTTSIIIAIAFACAVSSVLVFCCLKVQQYFREGKGWMLVSVFSFFALLSMFFNFNSIYGNFINDDLLVEEAKDIKGKLDEIRIKSLTTIDEFYQYTKLKTELKELKLLAEREAKDKYRPGKGPLWREIDLQIPPKQAKFESVEKNYNIQKDKVETIYYNSLQLLNFESKKVINQLSIQKAMENHNEIGILTNALVNGFQFERLKFVNNVGKPDFALIALYHFLFSTPNSKTSDEVLTNKEKSSIIISLFISFLLDFPVFIILVILNWKVKRKDIKNIFDQNDLCDTNNRNRETKTNKFSWE